MTDNSKVLEKIKKLMKLSQSGNSNEASLALQRAKELMDKYQISLSDVVLSDVKEVEGMKMKAQSLSDYQNLLLNCISRLFSCEVILQMRYDHAKWKYNTHPLFIGVQPNADIAAYCFEVLNKQLERDRTAYMKGIHRNTSTSKKTKRADDFAFGWVAGINRTVRRLVPDFEMPEIVTRALKIKQDSGRMEEGVEPRKTGLSNGTGLDTLMGYDKGSKVELRHGMSGGRDQKQLNS